MHRRQGIPHGTLHARLDEPRKAVFNGVLEKRAVVEAARRKVAVEKVAQVAEGTVCQHHVQAQHVELLPTLRQKSAGCRISRRWNPPRNPHSGGTRRARRSCAAMFDSKRQRLS